MAKKKSIFLKWSHELTPHEKEKVRSINKTIIVVALSMSLIIILWVGIAILRHYIANSEIDFKMIYCKGYEDGARVAIYNEGKPKQVEITVKGIGNTMEVKTQRVYLAQGETRNLDFPFSIYVDKCEASRKIIG